MGVADGRTRRASNVRRVGHRTFGTDDVNNKRSIRWTYVESSLCSAAAAAQCIVLAKVTNEICMHHRTTNGFIAAPTVLNSLALDIRSCDSSLTLCRLLKTFMSVMPSFTSLLT